MLQAVLPTLARRASPLLAATVVAATACALPAQTARPRPPATRTSTSAAADPARIQQDEARLLAILARNPDHAGALAGMGWVRSRQKNYPAAVSYLERALSQRPNDPQLTVALDEARFRVLLAEAQRALASGNPDSACRFYSAAFAIHPHNREAFEGLRTASRNSTASEIPTATLLTGLIQLKKDH